MKLGSFPEVENFVISKKKQPFSYVTYGSFTLEEIDTDRMRTEPNGNLHRSQSRSS